VTSVYSRSFASAQGLADRLPYCQPLATAQELADVSDLVFITTPDSVIAEVAAGVRWRPGQGAVHCCGAASTGLLQGALDQGAATGAFHPFQTFAGLAFEGTKGRAEAAERMSGVSFAVAGNGWTSAFLTDMAHRLGGHPLPIPDSDRALYHAAAVLACGHLAALLQGVVAMWEDMGFTQQEAMRAIYPLSRTTLDAVAKQGAVSSATGPIVRGDVATVRAHLEALFQRLPELVPLYGALAAASLPIAEKRGVGSGGIEAMQELIDHYVGVDRLRDASH
jgi:predicted short-subunit dehydrogenase-like oxidoreductase (DUF2520 family)